MDIKTAVISNLISTENEKPPTNADLQKFDHLKSYEINELENPKIQVLIDAKHAHTFYTHTPIVGLPSDPIGLKTKFGLALIGPRFKPAVNIESLVNNQIHVDSIMNISVDTMTLVDMINRMFRIDFISRHAEMFPAETTFPSVNDELSLKQLEESIKYDPVKRRWIVGMPWRYGREETAKLFAKIDFLKMCQNRHKKFGYKLNKDPVLKEGSFKQMSMTMAEGHIRILDNLDAPSGYPVCYLPNHVVVKPNKPGKFRICQDAASKVGKHSLNSYLFSGPDLLNKLITVILRFRQKKYTLSADIKNYYYQICIDERDASALRYLWWSDETLREVVAYESTRHIFGVTSSPTVANYVLKKHAEYFKDKMTPMTFFTLLYCFYVDDLLTSVDTKEEAILLKKELVEILELGGFHLTKWNSNIPELCDASPTNANHSPTVDSLDQAVNQTAGPSCDDVNAELDGAIGATITLTESNPISSENEVENVRAFLDSIISVVSKEGDDNSNEQDVGIEPDQFGHDNIVGKVTTLTDTDISDNSTTIEEITNKIYEINIEDRNEKVDLFNSLTTHEQNTPLSKQKISSDNRIAKTHKRSSNNERLQTKFDHISEDGRRTEDLADDDDEEAEEDPCNQLSPQELVRLISDNKWESEIVKNMKEGEHSILGVGYSFVTDELNVSIGSKADKKLETKRDLLSFIAGIYDPCGFVAPWCLEGRNYFQKINSPDIPWNSDLPTDLIEPVNKWVKSVVLLKRLKINRWTNPLGLSDCITEICIFCDSSTVGWGLTCYLRKSVKGATDKSQISVSFLISKSHVVPSNMNINPTKEAIDHGDSIPRLELNAAKAAAQWRDYFSREYCEKVDKFYLFTDSMTVWGWIHDRKKRFKCYENFRIKSIRSLSDMSEWRHVPTKDNPADLCSKGIHANETKKWIFLHSGPSFLYTPYSDWPPVHPTNALTTSPIEVEFSALSIMTINGTVEDPAIVVENQPFHPWPLKVSSRVDDWRMKIRRVAIIVKVIQVLKERVENKKKGILPTRLRPRKEAAKEKLILHLSEEERNRAEYLLVNAIQSIAFEKEMAQLVKLGVFSENSLNELNLKNSKLSTLSPFIDERNVMRAGGRIAKADFLPYDTRFPIILPNHHTPEVRSLIRYYHNKNFHASIKQTLSSIRHRYFILGGQTAVNSVLSTCLKCQKMNKQPSQQREGNLPFDRLAVIAPFTNCGIDCFGPFHLRHKLRGTKKQFVLLACCMSTRAVTLVPLRDMTTSALINALIKIHAQFPALKRLYCDNGSNFKGAEREIREAVAKWKEEGLNRQLEQHELEWVFGPAYCGSAGGAWERLIGMSKKLIRAVIGTRTIDLDDFECLLAGASSIMNQRPLTATSTDINDSMPLTPSHFLYPYMFIDSNHLIPPSPTGDEHQLQDGWRSSQRLLDEFWRCFRTEYLTELARRRKIKPSKPIRVGDLVIIADFQEPREYWAVGRILEIINDDTPHPRRFLIRTQSGKCIDRHISSVIRIELPEYS